MAVTLLIPDDIAEAAEQAAGISGVTADQVLIQALRAHFPPIPDALQREFDAVERASDEDWMCVEAGIEKAAHENTFIEKDPVIEAYKKDIDRTLIRENMRRSVTQRFENLMALQEFAEEMKRAGDRQR